MNTKSLLSPVIGHATDEQLSRRVDGQLFYNLMTKDYSHFVGIIQVVMDWRYGTIFIRYPDVDEDSYKILATVLRLTKSAELARKAFDHHQLSKKEPPR